MPDTTKIELSKLELELMKNQEWILTKHRVTDKISSLFSAQVAEISQLFPVAGAAFEHIRSARPKISKGERYLGLPYLVLDYPAVFSKQDIFALRTMFLWGNFISVTLHLSGKYKIYFQENIINRVDTTIDNLYVGIGEDPWLQHFSADAYLPVNSLGRGALAQHIIEHPFLKIALRCSLQEINEMDKDIKKSCRYMAGLL